MSMIATPETLQQATDYLRAADPILAEVIITSGVVPSIIPNKDYYQKLVESIVSQQLSIKAADTILQRFIDLFPGDGFPTPELILTKDIEALRGVGLSRQKGNYIQDLAVKVIEGTVQFDHLDGLTNDEVIAELTQVKGVGVWTVHMFLMFCMGRLDVLPIGDLGIKNGVWRLYHLDQQPTPEQVAEVAELHGWAPYQTVASWYVWHSLDNKPAI